MINKYKTDVLKLNIQEQVQYLTDLHETSKSLVSWGIRVIDRVDTVEELDNIDVTTLEYGDAVAVGTESPFFFYIWTRASIGTDSAYWFPFGEITTPGPEGPPGESIVGPTGPRGSKWFTGSSQPLLNEEVKDGDMFLDQSGNVVQAITYSNGTRMWAYVTNLKGAPGVGNPGPAPIISNDGTYITSTNPQTGVTTNVIALEALKGRPGNPGPAGGFINIRGILPQGPLPTPEALNDLTAAYLVGTAAPYTLYVQVGETVETAQWRDVGPFNAATAVRVNGVYEDVWDADTKLDKITTTTSTNQVYVKSVNGEQAMLPVSSSVIGGAIINRTTDGNILVPTVSETSNVNYAANKNYVDTKFLAKQTGLSQLNQVYVKTTAGNNEMFNLDTNETANTIARRNASGMIYVAVPADESSASFTNGTAVNKGYVNNKFLAKPATAINGVVRYNTADGTTSVYSIYQSVPPAGGNAIPLCKANGRLVVGTPVDGVEAVNKNFIDLVEGSIIIGGESFIKRVPAYLKNEPEAYIGACCFADEVRHVLMGYDYDNDEFVVYDMSDETSTMQGDYTIEQ